MYREAIKTLLKHQLLLNRCGYVSIMTMATPFAVAVRAGCFTLSDAGLLCFFFDSVNEKGYDVSIAKDLVCVVLLSQPR